uniref:Uncharacterized protein n=1 Tax=Cucumis melo TaxID=3656 RepID=A0A9I9E5X6_CUCME
MIVTKLFERVFGRLISGKRERFSHGVTRSLDDLSCRQELLDMAQRHVYQRQDLLDNDNSIGCDVVVVRDITQTPKLRSHPPL